MQLIININELPGKHITQAIYNPGYDHYYLFINV